MYIYIKSILDLLFLDNNIKSRIRSYEVFIIELFAKIYTL